MRKGQLGSPKPVTLPGGLRLEYVEQGDPVGVPVVLLHAIADSWRTFERVLSHLPRSIHAFAPTQRGHGDADRPPANYHPRDFAADVAAFLDVVGLESAVIVGASSGGRVALRFAIDTPARTRGLVLIGTPATFRDKPGVEEISELTAALTDPIDPGLVREMARSIVARSLPPEFLETIVHENLKVPARVWQATMQGLLDDELFAEVGAITAPTLIIWGDQDTIAPRADQGAMVATIPEARLVVYPGTGHSPHWEEPARVAADLAAFAEHLIRNPDE